MGSPPPTHHKSDLIEIARQAMIDRGLVPDFSPQVAQKLAAIAGPAPVSDRRGPGHARASLVLDRQRRLARPRPALGLRELPGGAVKILVAIADVDALVAKGSRDRRPRAAEHDLGLHGGPDLPDAAGAAVDGPDVSARRTKTGCAIVVEMSIGPDGSLASVPTSIGRRSATARSSPTTASEPGSRARARFPRPPRAVPGMDAQLKTQDARRAAAARAASRTGRARARDDRAAAPSSTAIRSSTSEGRAQSRARVDRGLHDRGQRRDGALSRSARVSRRCGASCARRSAGSGSSTWPRRRARRSPASRTRARSRSFSPSDAGRIPCAFPISRSSS